MKFTISIFILFCSFLGFNQSQSQNIQAIVQMGHGQYITCSDFSPNGKFVITGSGDNSIILWDTKYGKQIRTFNHHYKGIKTVNFSHNGQFIVSTSKDNTTKIIDITTSRVIQSFSFKKEQLSNAYFSQDDSKLIIINDRDGYEVWDVKSASQLGQFKKDYSAHREEHILNATATKVLSKINYKSVACISLITNDTLFTLPFDKAYTLNFSNDDKYIIIGSSKLFATVFDAETGKLLHTLKSDYERGCDGCNTTVTVSKNSKYVFTMSSKNDGILWDLKTSKQLKKLGDFDNKPYNVDFSTDGKYLLLSTQKEVFVYNIKANKLVFSQKNEWIYYYQFKFSTIGNQIILPAKNNTIQIWDIDKNRVVKTLKGYLNQQKANGLDFSATNYWDKAILHYISLKNNISLSTNNSSFLIGKVDSSAISIDIKSGKKTHVFTSSKSIIASDYSTDGKWLALAGGDKKIYIYNTKTNQLTYTLKGHGALIFDLQFSESSKELISGSWDASILVWDFKNESIKQRLELGSVSPYLVRYSPNDLYIVSGDLGKNIDFWEKDSKQKFRSLVGHTKTISDIEFSTDQKTMVTSSWDGKIKVWDVLTGMIISKMSDNNSPVYSVCYSNTPNEIISGGSSNLIQFWDSKTGQLKQSLKGHTSAITDIKLTADGKYMVSSASNGEVIVWDFKTKQEIYTYLQINQTDWLVKTPNGYFDGSANALSLVNYVSGVDVMSINALFDKYYTPNLVTRLMAGDQFNDVNQNLKQLITNRPLIEFEFASIQSRDGKIHQDSVYKSKTKTISLDVALIENGKTITEIRLYNNGKLLANQTWNSEIIFRGKPNVQPFEIDLVNGTNTITAIAVSESNIESEPIALKVAYSAEAVNSDLYIISIGINDYKNASYNLNYAVKDANDFSKSVVKGADTLFDNIYTYNLRNSKATKAEMIATFNTVKSKIDQEDVLVFYYAGHGVMSLGDDSDFYLVAHNVTNLYGDHTLLNNEGMSASELMAFSKDIVAQKQLFILDACHSGGALNSFATRGDGREKAIAQLARNTGTFFLTASQDIQYANESGDLKHGLFTYALLEVLKGENSASATDGKITINEIKTYVEERVPELSEKYHGSSQYPTSYSFGQDFPIVILK